MIRWTRFFLIVTPLALLWVGVHFFLDRGIRSALEKTGTALNGASVNVDRVRTRFWNLSVLIGRVQVADPDAPMTNRLDIESLRLGLELKPLFWRRVVVDRAEITGVQSGTARRRSGAVTKKSADQEKPSFLEKKAAAVGTFALDNLSDAYDPQNFLSLETMESWKRVKKEQERLTALEKTWEQKIKGLKTDGLDKRVKTLVERIKTEKFSGLDGVVKAQALLEEGKALQKEIKNTRTDFQQMASDLTGEIAGVKTTLRTIDRLRRDDVERALAKVKFGISPQGITQGILGPPLFGRVQTVLGLMNKVQNMLPDTKTKGPPPRVRQGQDIPFPFRHRWPAFHLKTASLSGTTRGRRPIHYTGTLKNISSDPVLVGEPLSLHISGAEKERSFMLKAVVTPSRPVGQSYEIAYAGWPLDGVELGQWKGPIVMETGRGRMRGAVNVKGNVLQGRLETEADGVRLLHKTDAQNPGILYRAVDDFLAGIRQGAVTAVITGTFQNPSFDLTTNLDNEFRKALAGAVDKQLGELKQILEKQAEVLLAKETEKLSELLSTKGTDVLNKLNLKGQNADVLQEQMQKALTELSDRGGRSIKIPDFKNIFKKKRTKTP